jgi:hypothetical protein
LLGVWAARDAHPFLLVVNALRLLRRPLESRPTSRFARAVDHEQSRTLGIVV